MIIKYKFEIGDTGKYIVVNHNEKSDYWFLPTGYAQNKGITANWFKTLEDIEDVLDVSLFMVEEV